MVEIATKEFFARICLKTDSEQNFKNTNPLLLDGELAIVLREDGSYSLKVGKENTQFNDLPYLDDKWRGVSGYNVSVLSQSEFDAAEKDENTLYFVFSIQ